MAHKKHSINVSYYCHYLQLLSAFSPLPKCRPKYIASKSGLPRMALLPTYQMSLEMRLSDYIVRFPGEIKEPPNSYIQIQKEIKSHRDLLSLRKNRAEGTHREEEKISGMFSQKNEQVFGVISPTFCAKQLPSTISSGITLF